MTLYLDTSSLVKLYVAESASDAVRLLVGEATVVATSVVAYTETRAVLSRLRREGFLNARTFASTRRDFESDWPTYFTLDATNTLCREAGLLAERYHLRGFDSIHLASFAEIHRCTGGSDIRFSSFDERLNRAAHTLTRILRRTRTT